jgi:hypothetical protein
MYAMELIRANLLKLRQWALRNWKELWWALVFAIVCAFAVEFGKDTWRGPSAYKVYLVGNLADREIQSVFNSFQRAAEKSQLEINGVPIQFELKNDQGDSAVAKRIADGLASAPDTLAVIGHVLSQQTKAAIPSYMAVDPRVPVIATTETDDDLLSLCPSCNQGFVPLIQMAPTNKAQSETAVRYATEHDRRRFLLVSELNGDNNDYVQNLMKDFREALKSYAYKGAVKVGEVSMGQPLSKESLHNWNPDCILYAGEHETAMTLISSLRSFVPPNGITVILSDSSVDRDLQNRENNTATQIRYTYSSDAYYFSKDLNVFGQDAFAILRSLISDSDAEQHDLSERIHKMLGMNRVKDARTDIINHMKGNGNHGIAYTGISGDTYKFFGYHREALFHVWEVRNGVVFDVDGWHPPKSGE